MDRHYRGGSANFRHFQAQPIGGASAAQHGCIFQIYSLRAQRLGPLLLINLFEPPGALRPGAIGEPDTAQRSEPE
jgi:hypothetical protein